MSDRIEKYPAITKEGAQAHVDELRKQYPNAEIRVEKGEIPQWGSAIPTSPTFGQTEPGYMVYVHIR